MKNNQEPKFGSSGIVETAKKAICTALLHHRAIGNEIVFWKDGKIVREKLTNASYPNHTKEPTPNTKLG